MTRATLVLAACAITAVIAAAVVVTLKPWAWTGGRRDPRRTPSDPTTYLPAQGEPLVFPDACDHDEAQAVDESEKPPQPVVVGALGDVLVHSGPHRQGLTHGFSSLWAPLAPLLAAPDVTYANFEGTVSGPGAPALPKGRSTQGNRLVYDPGLASALASAGIDVVSTANNHALDGGTAGVIVTLDALTAAGIKTTGTRKPKAASPWFTVTETRGLRLAWVACSEWTNVREPDRRAPLVLHCHRHRDEVLALIEELSRRADIHGVIVTPHGGLEGLLRADRLTRALAHDFVDAGALAVLGNHPHVLQQWERVRAADGRDALVSTCTGASFTAIDEDAWRAGAFLLLGLDRGPDGKARLRAVRHVPLVYERRDERFVLGPARASETPAAAKALARVLDLLSPKNEAPPALPFDLQPAPRLPSRAGPPPPAPSPGSGAGSRSRSDFASPAPACRAQDGRSDRSDRSDSSDRSDVRTSPAPQSPEGT